VPRVTLGCGNFGGVGSAPEWFGRGLGEEAAFAVMDAAWELGLTHFDTADAYGGGRSETTIGRWMRARGTRPMITTKAFNPMDEGADHGLARDRVRRQLQGSLERLGVDRVDLFLAHDHDPDVAARDLAATFAELQRDGLATATGVSNYDAAQLREALDAGPLACVQNSFSLLDRADDAALLDECATAGVGYVAFSPLAGGWLTGKYRRGEPFPSGSRMTQRPEPYEPYRADAVFDALDRLERRAREHGVSIAALALRWLLADDRITAIVVGPARPEHLEPVREALAGELDGSERAEIAGWFAARPR